MPIVEAGFPSTNLGESKTRLRTFGPTIFVDVGFDAEYDHRQGKPPRPTTRQVPALIDTGASSNCIDTKLAKEIGLFVVNRTRVSGVGGPIETDVYLAQIHSPIFNLTAHGQFTGVRLAAGDLPHSVLLGRDFLRNFIMIYDGPRAQVTLIR